MHETGPPPRLAATWRVRFASIRFLDRDRMADGGEQPIFTRRDCGRRGFGNEEGSGHQHGNRENGKYYGEEQER
jgi:hypothetical protein